jgi:tetratricopeptide (TPR) repeat protein
MDASWRRRIALYTLLAALGFSFLGFGLWLGDNADRQAMVYNRGLSLAARGDTQEAIEAFETAAQIYLRSRQKPWLERLLLPQPDRELAALALAHQGFILAVKENKAAAAVETWERSLALNSGEENQPGPALVPDFGYSAWYCAALPEGPLTPRGNPLMEGGADVCRVARMRAEADIARFNLELLKRSPGLPEGAEKGSGKKKKKKGRPEEKKEQPAEMPGGKGDTKVTPNEF